MADIPNPTKRELAILAVLWDLGEATVRQVYEELRDKLPIVQNTVQAFLEPYALISETVADFESRLAASEFVLPPGYRLEFGGESEQRSDALAKLASFALPLFVVMAGTIILSFNSFRYAGVIFSVAGLSVGLALLGVWMFGYPMGFLAIVGTMGLVGLAINGGIVVLSALRVDAKARDADPEATLEVVVGATRHIVATTLTTVVGFVPLLLGGGTFWPPLAVVIAGGVGLAVILSLGLTPVAYALSRSRRDSRAKRGHLPLARSSAAAPAA